MCVTGDSNPHSNWLKAKFIRKMGADDQALRTPGVKKALDSISNITEFELRQQKAIENEKRKRGPGRSPKANRAAVADDAGSDAEDNPDASGDDEDAEAASSGAESSASSGDEDESGAKGSSRRRPQRIRTKAQSKIVRPQKRSSSAAEAASTRSRKKPRLSEDAADAADAAASDADDNEAGAGASDKEAADVEDEERKHKRSKASSL